jgi:hypothetical protein
LSGLKRSQLQINRFYKKSNWKDDFINLIKKAGILNIPTMLLISDENLIFENILDDLNHVIKGLDIFD